MEEIKQLGYWRTYRAEWYAFILAIIFYFAFSFYADWINQNPLNERISLSPPGVVEKEISMHWSESYSLYLRFSNGGQLQIDVPVRVTLYDESGNNILKSVEAVTNEVNSHGDTYNKRVKDFFIAGKGTYKIKIEILKDVPDFKYVDVYATLYPSYGGNAPTTVMGSLILLGGYFNYVIVRLAICFFAFCIVINTIRWKFGRRNGIIKWCNIFG